MTKTGSLTVNGVTDADLVRVLQIKEKNERALGFNPQQLQVASIAQSSGGPPKSGYNNMVISWNADGGLEAIIEVLNSLRAHSAPL